MTHITTMIFLLLTTLASFSSSDAASCLNVSSTPAMYNLCQETLQHTPETAAVTVYAIEAAKVTWESYRATEDEAMQQIFYGRLPDDERAAYERCLMMYATAQGRMAAVMEEMNACDFERTVGDYANAKGSMESCAYTLSGFQGSSLVAMNAADRDVTTVAIDLGGLIVGNDG